MHPGIPGTHMGGFFRLVPQSITSAMSQKKKNYLGHLALGKKNWTWDVQKTFRGTSLSMHYCGLEVFSSENQRILTLRVLPGNLYGNVLNLACCNSLVYSVDIGVCSWRCLNFVSHGSFNLYIKRNS